MILNVLIKLFVIVIFIIINCKIYTTSYIDILEVKDDKYLFIFETQIMFPLKTEIVEHY